MKKALVLNSGGVDSTTCVSIAVKDVGKENVTTVSVYYGQKHSKELECAEKVAQFYGVPHKVIDLSKTGIFDDSNCPLLSHSTEEVPDKSYAEQIAENGEGMVTTYVPFRNGLLLSSVAALAMALYPKDDVDIYLGAHADDAAGRAYADCSDEFCKAMYDAISIGTYEKVKVVAPLVNLNKAGVVKMGLELGTPYHLTWSCISTSNKIFTLGGYKYASEVKEGDYVWGFTDKWTPAKIETVWFSKKPVYNVIVQDQIGRLTSFRCTDDHRLMLRDGTYKMLRDCLTGDKLMPAYPTTMGKYYQVHEHNDWKESPEYMHRIVASHFGFIDEIVHHKDNDGKNNSPDNLQGVKWGEHTSITVNSEEFKKANNSLAANEKRANTVAAWWDNMTPQEYAYQKYLISKGRLENHTIKMIEFYGEDDVFDIQTSTSNFAIDAGIFVHNCYRGGEKPCGKCGTCIDRAAAFAANGVADPAL